MLDSKIGKGGVNDGFVKATNANPQLLKNELDILGENNLAVVGEGEGVQYLESFVQ